MPSCDKFNPVDILLQTMVAAKVTQLRQTGDVLETSTLEQITRSENNFTHLNDVVTHAMAVLEDTKSRHATIAKTRATSTHRGPLLLFWKRSVL